MRLHLVSAAAGLLFALGLGISGMTDPTRIIGFLDVTGRWDPSLAFVMAGAIGVHYAFARRAQRRPVTLAGAPIHLPTRTVIDRRLLIGAALFGVGWGVSGYCPGPALVALSGGASLGVVVFVAAMVTGMIGFLRFDARPSRPMVVRGSVHAPNAD